MKIKVLLICLLLSGCSNNISNSSSQVSSSSEDNSTIVSTNNFNPYYYINDIQFEDLKSKIENKEDFIFILSSKNCSWCNKQFDNIYDNLHLEPEQFYFYYVDELFVNLEKNNDGEPLNGEEKYNQAVYEYRYFASIIEKVGDFILGEEGAYIKDNYTERFGEKEPSLLYPSTLMFIKGEPVIEFSYLGYGWTETEEKFIAFIRNFNNIKNI